MRALATGESEAFMESEIEAREMLSMPPFGRLTALILSGPDEVAVIAAGRTLAAKAPQGEGIEVLGPAPAFMALLRGSIATGSCSRPAVVSLRRPWCKPGWRLLKSPRRCGSRSMWILQLLLIFQYYP